MRCIIAIALIVLCLCVLPATAMLLELRFSGTVSSLDSTNNTLTIAHPASYHCPRSADGQRICVFTPTGDTSLTGTVPSDTAFQVFNSGDPVFATMIGGKGGTWITLAKLTGPAGNGTVTDIIGEPNLVPLPYSGDYRIGLLEKPDCLACSGTICKAASSTVNILSGGSQVMTGDLQPGRTITYDGRNDGSSVMVTFVYGQTPSSPCDILPRQGMSGPQAISQYIIHVVPPVGSTAPSLQETVAIPATNPPEETMPVEARSTAAKSGTLPFAAAGALALAAVLVISRGKFS